jgi:STE24 endopeptidase
MATADETTSHLQKPPERAKQYSKSKLAVGLLRLVLTFAFLAIFLLSGASDRLHDILGRFAGNYYLQLTCYLLVFLAVYHLLFLGLGYYSALILERRYDLSNQMVAGWLARSAKEWLLSAVLTVVGFNLLYCLVRNVPNQWWLFASLGWFLLLVFLGKITPAVIVPLFYKLSPLKDSELAERLRALAERCGVRVRRVLEIKLSRETKKANAAVVGLGRERRILIGDTLMDLCSHDEIEAVFAHELAHVALHHGWKLLGAAAASSVIAFYLLFLFLDRSALTLGFEGACDIPAVPLLLLWVMAFGLTSRPFQAALSRHFERQADLFIVGKVEKPETLASALTKLAARNLADPAPSRLVELLFYDHPPIAKRLSYLREAAHKKA